ncbi:MAG: hypothetical protein ACTSP4_08545 [Candidatus Hodarchaeales archaeon]
MANALLPALVTLLHDLFTAIWIGGMIVLAFIILPSIRKTLGKSPETKQLIDTIKNRLSLLIYLCIAGLFVTGLMLTIQSPSAGLFDISTDYSMLITVKHLVFFLMVIIAITRSRLLDLWKGLSRNTYEKLNMVLLLSNIVLGVLAILLTNMAVITAATLGS